MSAGLRPAEAAEQLGISTATLRRWAQQFSAFLAPAAAHPASGRRGQRGHRRYSPEDVATLAACGRLLAAGLTFEQARARLGGQEGGVSALALLPDAARETGGREMAAFFSDTLHSLTNSQEIVLSNQQVARQLLGVVLQDNFNLKEENTRLRERMLETERALFELKREMDAGRSQERERMRQMEAQLFEMQRRLDGLPTAPASARLPAPAMLAPAPAVAAPAPAPPADLVAAAETFRRRSFWDWLRGR
ncbi:MAG: MerR family transcriptional regulator [Caldilineales bacterium]|nr:MerR family transcriptional regulator [Caldilineales bacterium]